MFFKSLSALLFSAACQADTTTLCDHEAVVKTETEGDITIRFLLDSELYYDDSLGDIQRLI